MAPNWISRVHLAPGQSAHGSLTIDPRSLGQVDQKGNRVLVPGEYSVSLGGAQPQNAASVLTGKFNVTGTAELPKYLRRPGIFCESAHVRGGGSRGRVGGRGGAVASGDLVRGKALA